MALTAEQQQVIDEYATTGDQRTAVFPVGGPREVADELVADVEGYVGGAYPALTADVRVVDKSRPRRPYWYVYVTLSADEEPPAA